MKQKIKCPECSSPLKVWIDIDASLFFNVSATGKLSKSAIADNTQSDGRCGLKCQECSWRVLGKDIEDDALLQVIKNADDRWQDLQLSVVRAKPRSQ
jgi:DNA-directed RNA polymerase subunit RPC12/RpoP